MEYSVDFIVQKILEALPGKESYSKASLTQLLADAGIDVRETEFALRYDVQDRIIKEAKKAGYVLDYSEYDNTIGGAPFNELAVIIKPGAVTEADFSWYSGGMRLVEDLALVQTKILQREIQIRMFNGRRELLKGFLFPVNSEQRVELFSLLEKCVSAWKKDDYSVDVCDGGSWEVRLLSGRKVRRKVCGTVKQPPLGRQLEKVVRKIVGGIDLYLF